MLDELNRRLRRLPSKGPGSGKRARLQKCIDYLESNSSRLRYREMLREDLDIGTGAVEGAVRNLVAIRLDGPGMRWGRGRAERVLHLRCILINSQWSDFVKWLKRGPPIELAAKPEPAQPYTAIAA